MYFTAISYLKDLIKHTNMQFPYYVIDIQIPLHFHLQCHVCVCVCALILWNILYDLTQSWRQW